MVNVFAKAGQGIKWVAEQWKPSNVVSAAKITGRALIHGASGKATEGKMQGFVVPGTFPAGGAVKAGSGALSSIKAGAKNLYRRMTTNPLAGQTLKSGLLKLGAGTAATIGSIKAFQLTRASAKNEPVNLIPTKKEVANALAIAYNAPVALAGALVGYGEDIIDKKILDPFADIRNTVNNANLGNPFENMKIPSMDIPSYKMPDFNIQLPEFNMPQMNPINITSSAPSLNVSGGFGGGSGLDLAAMALLLGAGGGYLLGRKRKKKKYKKRRKH